MVQENLHPIEGVWLPFKAELAGEAAPAMALAKMKLEIRANTYAVLFGNEVTDSGSFSLHDGDAIHTITLQGENGVNKGRTIPSIYQLVGDRLRICFGLNGVTPSAFSAAAGTKCYLVTYRRIA
ncbi:MAG: TIGR03067 domain-containing protein [Nibricoccus sp.]